MFTKFEKDIRDRFELASLPMHMTHFHNFDSILKQNGLISSTKLKELQLPYTDISNQSVQEKRTTKVTEERTYDLHNYIPLYFGKKCPMISALRNLNDSILFMAFTFDILFDLPCIITDGNAADAQTKFVPYLTIDDFKLLDVKAINSAKFAYDPEIKRRKQAELLVLDFLPLKYLKYVICPSDMIKIEVEKRLLAAGIKASVYLGGNSYYYK